MPHLMREVLPVDASYEDLEVDDGLGFLDGYVQGARDRGLPDYAPPEEDVGDDGAEGSGSGVAGGENLRFGSPTPSLR